MKVLNSSLFSSQLPLFFFLMICLTSCGRQHWPPPVQEMDVEAPVLNPEEALESFFLPPGYDIKLVASEPMVVDPVDIEFGPDGKMWVVEMRSFMPNIEGKGERVPTGKIAVLEDTNGDGHMDQRTTYLDSLILPRAIKVLEEGVLVGAPPHLWWTVDTNGDGKADKRKIVREDYGSLESNPEHNANGLMWGMDNWIHNADYDGRFYYRRDTFAHSTSIDRGQWEISMDNYGRIYTNSNSHPLYIDLLNAHYYTRNPNMMRRAGLYEDLVDDETVWPVRPTPGVNRGYRPHLLREDSTLSSFTAAGSPISYRGDRLPEELQGDVFVSEPAGNLVRRFVVEENNEGELKAFNPYDSAEFLTSTDERFRPVNFANGPDGTFYVVDMYRGIIQHRDYITDYLEEQIRRRNLEKPVGLGRIYRIVHKTTDKAKAPQLTASTSETLVDYLSHPNGWWRDMAQQLIVQRGDTVVAPALREMMTSSGEELTRLHALWTLDGINSLNPRLLKDALADESAYVRASAIRIAESWKDPSVRKAVLQRMDDEHPAVRRQLAASLGELALDDRHDVMARVLYHYGEDPVVVDAVISGLHGEEMTFLSRLVQSDSSNQMEGRHDVTRQLSATAFNAGSSQNRTRIFTMIGEEDRPSWQRLALMQGVEDFAPSVDDDDIERVDLEAKPAGLLAAADAADTVIRKQARGLQKVFYWPGKSIREEEKEVKPLTAAEQERFEKGKQLYRNSCAPCHGNDGKGRQGLGVRLIGSDWVLDDPQYLTRIVLQGKEGDNLMPPMRQLSKQEVASVLTYIRRAWGNRASAVDSSQVDGIMNKFSDRDQPWTEGELERLKEKLKSDS